MNVPPAFVFNVDESGFIDYIDMHDEIVIVPFNAPPGTVKSAERNSKRSTMIGTISIDGTKLKPYIVLTNKTWEKELIINGYGDSNVLKVYQENGFITSESFGQFSRQMIYLKVYFLIEDFPFSIKNSRFLTVLQYQPFF